MTVSHWWNWNWRELPLMPPTDIPAWVRVQPPQRPTILQHWDGLPSITLSMIPGGARLLWIFHEDYPDQLGLFVHLDDFEAQQVFAAPSNEGLLESVRSRLRDRDAFVWRKTGNMFGTESFRIPKRGDEPSFAESLWDAAEQVEMVLDLALEKRQTLRAPTLWAEAATAEPSSLSVDAKAMSANRQLAWARESTLAGASVSA
ncbi:hypothetical protein [Rhodococcoides navarretei]|uniref:Uncharacterized protein n=1 Tax=Rhodococcus navarretei TaxID=3128981 RepID=A0ABU9CSP4_9NOCA